MPDFSKINRKGLAVQKDDKVHQTARGGFHMKRDASSFPFKDANTNLDVTNMPFRRSTGMGGVKQEEDLIKDISTDNREVGGRFGEIRDGEPHNPKYRDKVMQVNRHLEDMKNHGASDEEVEKEKQRLMKDLKDNIATAGDSPMNNFEEGYYGVK